MVSSTFIFDESLSGTIVVDIITGDIETRPGRLHDDDNETEFVVVCDSGIGQPQQIHDDFIVNATSFENPIQRLEQSYHVEQVSHWIQKISLWICDTL